MVGRVPQPGGRVADQRVPVKLVDRMRAITKRVVERVVVVSGALHASRWQLRDRCVVLAYHNIVPDDFEPDGDRSLHLTRCDFRAQLDRLRVTHDIVPLDTIVHQTSTARRVRPRAAITFDDAYLGAVTHGVEEIVARGLSATIFVAPAFLDGRAFWWDLLADPHKGLRADLRSLALEQLCGRTDDLVVWAGASGIPIRSALHAVMRCAGLADLNRAAQAPGITIASHSWSHPDLTRLSGPQLQEELAKPLAWLHTHVPGAMPWLAYPYGAFDATVAAAAARAGYDACLALMGAWTSVPPADRYSIPRVNVSAGSSLAGFQLRAAGVLRR
jgi:peptidoglycan/xylan/chitin deacetylase (PgdA/CDA1 family)